MIAATGRASLDAFAFVIVLSVTLITASSAPGLAQPVPPGGFIEAAASTAVRPVLTPAQIQALLPARGPFTFPAPYLTAGVRLTNATDCPSGQDCLNYVGYSYWRNMNNHAGSNTMYVFLTLDRAQGGSGPTLFSYNKITGAVTKVGPLFEPSSGLSWASGEGWYFSATQPNALYLNDGPALKRYDVVTRTLQTVFDVSTQPGLFGANRYIWQVHSSNDDRVHSATLRDRSSFAELGCLAYRQDTNQYFYYPRIGAYDECQIDKSGRWLVIKENVDGANGEDNRIIDLQTGLERRLLDQNGAAGHSDTGYGYMVAADNWASQGNTMKVWKFDQTPLQGSVVYHTATWADEAPNHVSHANSKATLPPGQQYACGSGANTGNSTRANEILCFPLDASMRVLVVAPVMTNLNASGGGDNYSKLPKGNLDVTGEYFIWTANLGGNRLDAFIVRVPSQLLTGAPPPPPPPADTTAPVLSLITATSVTTEGATVTWTTNEASDTQVEYGLTTSYGNTTVLNASLVTSHAQALSGLAAATLYHFRVKSRDASGNLATSGDFTFTTLPGDLDGDGKSDVLLRNRATGQNIAWEMNGTGVAAAAFLPAIADTNWAIRGVGDFNADGKADVIWRHTSTGQNILWLMNGLSLGTTIFGPTIADTNWEIRGVGDFDRNGKADVVWRHRLTGQNLVWLMDGTTVASSAFLSTIADTNWEIKGVGDFDGDAKADVIWRHRSSGQNIVWLMNGAAVSVAAFGPTIADTNWEIVGVGDANGDGKGDVLWRNKATGQTIGWQMNGTGVATSAFLPAIADTNWEIKAVTDADGDGKVDVVWRNQVTGQNILWLMNGLSVNTSAFLPTIADTNWQIVGPS